MDDGLEDRPGFDDYAAWLDRELVPGFDRDSYLSHYESVTRRALVVFGQSGFWRAVIANLQNIDARYYGETRFHLLADRASDIALSAKPYESFLEKTYRRNILHNANWPDSPDDGWLMPPEWLSDIKDIVRTSVFVQYLDGVEYLTEALSGLCEQHNLTPMQDLEARPEGYYAAHFVVALACELPALRSADSETRTIHMEIQIATLVHKAIRKLLHKHYERNRLTPTHERRAWQWDYESKEFATSYLGHITHYVDGMIMGLRDSPDMEQR